MNQHIEPSLVKRALGGHAALGLITGALLYLVCLTGTLSVFHAEWQRVEQQGVPEMAFISSKAVQRAVVSVLASEAGKTPTSHLYVHLPVPDMPRTTVITDSQAVHVHADGSLAQPEQVAWSKFLLTLHYALNIPGLVGITLVGAAGAMMLALSLSGVLAHPRIFRDAFRLRARDVGGVGLADWHNRLSVWSLPFSLAIALTGAMIGLGTVTAYGLAGFYHKGDSRAVYATIFGEEEKPDKTPDAAPDVAAALDFMQARFPFARPTQAVVHDPGTRGQMTQIWATHPRRLIFAEYYNFDGSGNFRGTVGLSDGKTGQQFASSAYRLHFGSYGGLPVKLAYLLLGAALTVICATGIHIWLGKRQRRGLHEPRLRKAWDAVVWGSPMALSLTLIVRLTAGNGAAFVAIFWGALTLAVAAAMLPIPPVRFRRGLKILAALLCALAMVLAF